MVRTAEQFGHDPILTGHEAIGSLQTGYWVATFGRNYIHDRATGDFTFVTRSSSDRGKELLGNSDPSVASMANSSDWDWTSLRSRSVRIRWCRATFVAIFTGVRASHGVSPLFAAAVGMPGNTSANSSASAIVRVRGGARANRVWCDGVKRETFVTSGLLNRCGGNAPQFKRATTRRRGNAAKFGDRCHQSATPNGLQPASH